nr:MAG TPA: hypothetical protein [Bacteriophage sp.]DAZ75745.1 MAG TPA: hypothetical protein [Caudoviricetes sp.]
MSAVRGIRLRRVITPSIHYSRNRLNDFLLYRYKKYLYQTIVSHTDILFLSSEI